MQIRELSHLRKVRKSRQKFKLANMRICDLRHLFADHLPLEEYFAHIHHALEIFAVVCHVQGQHIIDTSRSSTRCLLLLQNQHVQASQSAVEQLSPGSTVCCRTDTSRGSTGCCRTDMSRGSTGCCRTDTSRGSTGCCRRRDASRGRTGCCRIDTSRGRTGCCRIDTSRGRTGCCRIDTSRGRTGCYRIYTQNATEQTV